MRKFNIPKDEYEIAKAEREGADATVQDAPLTKKVAPSKKTPLPAIKSPEPTETEPQTAPASSPADEIEDETVTDASGRPLWLDNPHGWLRHEKKNRIHRMNTGYDDMLYLYMQKESRRRGISMTMLVNIAIWEYMNGPNGKIKIEDY